MTVIAAETRTGRSLVTDAEFDTLAAFCADEYGLERCVADRVIDQALAHRSENPGVAGRVAAVRSGWSRSYVISTRSGAVEMRLGRCRGGLRVRCPRYR